MVSLKFIHINESLEILGPVPIYPVNKNVSIASLNYQILFSDDSTDEHSEDDANNEFQDKQPQLHLLGNITSAGDVSPQKTKALKKKIKKKAATKIADLKQEEVFGYTVNTSYNWTTMGPIGYLWF